MEKRNLTIVQNEIFEYKEKLYSNEIIKSCATDKAVTREALVKKIYELEDELEAIYASHQVDPNIEVTATIVTANRPEV